MGEVHEIMNCVLEEIINNNFFNARILQVIHAKRIQVLDDKHIQILKRVNDL